jgi:hypothetical protein
MRSIPTLALALLASFACPVPALAAGSSQSDDRLTLTANGSTLTGTNGGGGGAIGWLHTFNANAIVGVAGEYQTIADSRWKFGSVNVALGHGPAEHRSSFYAEGHVGSGDDAVHSFDYTIVAAGLIQNVTRQLSVQLEDKRIDIDTTHGNLPKLALQFLWSPSLLASASYAHSVSGNLGTKLGSVRIDRYGKTVNLIVGGAGGKASPAVVDLQTGLTQPGLTLREGFIGVARPFRRFELTLLGDYLKLAETERVTLTLNCTVHLRSPGGPK